MAQFAAAGAAAVAIGTQVGSGFAAAKVIRLENQTNKKIHFSSNWKSIDVDASRHCDVDWAYAVLGVFGTVPDVTIRWTTNEGDYSQLVVEGSLIQVHADGTHTIYGPGNWDASSS